MTTLQRGLALTLFAWLLFANPLMRPARAAAPNAPDAPRPNFLFIIADDLGWADVAFHDGRTATPHLDRLAAQSIELTQHYVYPVCSPTRAALLTGRYATRFGVTSPTNARAFPWDTVTLASALKSAGYDTGLFGKWHLGSMPEEGPQKFGFDHSYGSLAGGVGPWDHRYKIGDWSVTWHRNAELIEEQGHVTDLLANEAVRWLESRGDRPFLLYLPFTAVHLPIREPDEYMRRVPSDITDPAHRQYAACIMHLDDAVGRVLVALEKTGKAANTLVVFTSDNGGSTADNANQPYPPDDYVSGKLPGDNRPFRGEKGQIYEGGIRVPTLVRWPGRLAPGKVDVPVAIVDWMPTFAALARYKGGQSLRWDGTNIWSLLTRENIKTPPRPIYIAAPGFRSAMVREGDWKLIVHAPGKGDKAASEKVELYNLATDPGEKKNQAAAHPELLKSLRKHLDKLSKSDRDAVAKD